MMLQLFNVFSMITAQEKNLIYYVCTALLSVLVLIGISRMSKVERAVSGNLLGSFSMLAAIILTLWYNNIFSVYQLYIGLLIGAVIGVWLSVKVKMIEMPQTVGLLNGFGGAASMIVGILTLAMQPPGGLKVFPLVVAGLAVFVGGLTFSGSVVAAGKLARWMPQRPIVLKGHPVLSALTLILSLVTIVLPVFEPFKTGAGFVVCLVVLSVMSLLFGILLAIRVGGADMPITISLLNSFSGVAGAIAGLSIGDPLLVAVGGIVGASGLLLTQIMCRAMNRHLMDILLGKTSAPTVKTKPAAQAGAKKASAAIAHVSASAKKQKAPAAAEVELTVEEKAAKAINDAKRVIIVPGYGMALSQAQPQVKQLLDTLEAEGKQVDFAIHPVAGRMPGHMNVLLAEVDIPYEKLHEMEAINPIFKDTDCVLVIGANDVINPAANTAEGTPIYGMPVLDVADAKHVVVMNFDLKPGYAGVDNPLYKDDSGKVDLVLGDAKDSLRKIMKAMTAVQMKADKQAAITAAAAPETPVTAAAKALNDAKRVIIIPGYGMALSQAQLQVKQLMDTLEAEGKQVDFAIHPVAGRMPGHMYVLLAEVDVPYEKLPKMEEIIPTFKDADVALVVGANDIVNPYSDTLEGTYGMPVIRVKDAGHVIFMNLDKKPGFTGVQNPLYNDDSGRVDFILGDAKDSLQQVMQEMAKIQAGTQPAAPAKDTPQIAAAKSLAHADRVIIVPGYGMALSQAQPQVKQLLDTLESDGKHVDFAIHPVAGRMPGHMNVLLAEVDVPYEKLHEMEAINPEFKDTDCVLVIGANDVINPAANTAEGTPIYGMPVLDVADAKHVVVMNFDLKPGYAGVDNPLYKDESGKVDLVLGDAKDSLREVMGTYAKVQAGALEEDVPAVTVAEDTPAIAAAKSLVNADRVIIVPGYGMALSQAQPQVKQLLDTLEAEGKQVDFAIHPVAGRMPGHMNVLLAEVDVPYEKLHEMEAINPEFKDTDCVLVIGANDVINPAANTAEGTPIYGMPVLDVADAKHVIVMNFDLKPGYAGVDNPLYADESGKVDLVLGDAKESLRQVMNDMVAVAAEPVASPNAATAAAPAPKALSPQENAALAIAKADRVIIVPGYGMALSQAQPQVKQLLDTLEAEGKQVDFAIHPVAGRMPGHMNVLLAEVDVPYEKLHEMEAINPEFANTDCVLIIGANDVINPAANTAEGTPIYGMPVLDVADAKHVVVMNFDLKPGYAGVDNPLYADESGKVDLVLGDAKDSLQKLMQALATIDTIEAETPAAETAVAAADTAPVDPMDKAVNALREAHKIIIVPGYGMALSQAQPQVKQLLDTLEAADKQVDFAIHPVAGRMPGHMNVLLAEVDVPYEKLHEMEAINPEFADTDCVLVVGANDVINPAANTAEGTPIYGMPVLDVADAKHVIMMNFDLKPGYAGVDNPLYADESGRVDLLLGDAKQTLTELLKRLHL